MELKLAPYFQRIPLGKEKQLFDQWMSMNGKVFRALEGRKTIRFERDGHGYYIKQHLGVGWKEIIKNWLQFRLPVLSAEVEWKALKVCQELGLLTLKVVGYGKRGWIPSRQQSFLITEELQEVTSLEDVCASWKQAAPSFLLKYRLIREIAHIARILHQHGLNHRDFYLCHFLLKNDSIDQVHPQLYLIDLHRVQIRNRTPFRWKVKDIAGLYFSAMDAGLTQRDLFRFLRYYFSKSLHDVFLTEKKFLNSVEQRAIALYRKSFRRFPELYRYHKKKRSLARDTVFK